MKTQILKSNCESLAGMMAQLDAGNWQNKPLEKRYHKLREKTVATVAELVNTLAQCGLVTVCAWEGENKHVSFEIESAGDNGGIQLNCKLEASGNSCPATKANIPGIIRK